MENLELLIDKIEPVLAELSNKLGIASEFLWKIMIRQQYVEGILGIFPLGIGIVIIQFAIKTYKNPNKGYDADMAVVMLGILGMIVVWIGMNIIIRNFLNPEYQALEGIFDLIQGNSCN